MWRPSTSKGSVRGVGAGGQAARAEVVAVQRAGDDAGCAGAAAGRAAGARPARRRRTRCPPARLSGCSRPRTPPQQVGVQRFGVEVQQCAHGRRLRRNWSRISAAEAASTSRRAGGQRLGGGVALVDLVHRQAEAARATGGRSAARARVLSCARAVGMEGHADDQRVGLPFARSAARWRRSARRPRRAMRLQRLAPGAAACCRRPRRRGGSEVESQKGLSGPGGRRARRALMRAPPPATACAGRCPAATARVRSAARPACRR